MLDLWYEIPNLNFLNFDENSNSDSSFKIKIITIDTDILIGSSSKDMDDSIQAVNERIKNQITWLEEKLISAANNNTDHIIVAGHHPIYAIGHHGCNEILIESVLPLLEKYDVRLYRAVLDRFGFWSKILF